MPIIGAVLTLGEGADLEALGADPRVTVGPRMGAKLPVVLDTVGRREDIELCDSLLALRGVLHIDVATADFSDLVGVES